MDDVFSFFSFQDANVRYVVIGSVLIASSSAITGCFTFLRKRALVSDAVAHAILPGVCLSFMVSGSKNPIFLIIGAFLTGWLSLLIIDLMTSKTKIKEDTAIGAVLSVFFGIGILLLTVIQHAGNATQSGLESFLFGKAAALVGNDLIVFSGTAIILTLTVVVFYKELMLIAFDKTFARLQGLPVRQLEILLTTLTVMAVVVGIQAVGVVLTSAMLITPAAAARYWTDKLKIMLVIAAALGAFSGVAGAFISYTAPKMPTGPWIVLTLSTLALLSFFAAPQKGFIAKQLKINANRRRFAEENVLKMFYHLGEKDKNFFQTHEIEEITQKRTIPNLRPTLRHLLQLGYLKTSGKAWQFTPEGLERGRKITKLHRLWELYLTEYLKLASDHVHDDAETMAHIITPEIEAELETRLNFPTADPHDEEIPYR